jgi:hypothetical protein
MRGLEVLHVVYIGDDEAEGWVPRKVGVLCARSVWWEGKVCAGTRSHKNAAVKTASVIVSRPVLGLPCVFGMEKGGWGHGLSRFRVSRSGSGGRSVLRSCTSASQLATGRHHEHPPFTTHQRTSPMTWPLMLRVPRMQGLKRVHGTSWPSRADLLGAQA